jgi:hypothetical protein
MVHRKTKHCNVKSWIDYYKCAKFNEKGWSRKLMDVSMGWGVGKYLCKVYNLSIET